MFMGRSKCFHTYNLSHPTVVLAGVSGYGAEEVTSPLLIVRSPGHMEGALKTWSYRFCLGDLVSNKLAYVSPTEAFSVSEHCT